MSGYPHEFPNYDDLISEKIPGESLQDVVQRIEEKVDRILAALEDEPAAKGCPSCSSVASFLVARI